MHLTRLGRGVLVAGVVMALGGWALGVAVAVVIGAFGIVLVACAATAVMGSATIHLSRIAHPAEVERGGPAEVRLGFRSIASRRARQWTVVEQIDGEPYVATIGPLPAGATAHVHYEVATQRRGVVTAGPLVVRRADPFGLVTSDQRFTSRCAVSVRPRRYALRMLPFGRQRDLEGPTRERSEGSASFHQLREYMPGDDLRRIHWRSTARTGQLLVKQMVDTSRPEIVLVLDNRTSTIGADDFEHAVDIVASIQWAADAEEFPTTLLFADGTLDVGTDGHPIPAIDRLTAVERGDADSLSQLAEVLSARGRSLVFVTGEPDEGDYATIARLAKGFHPAYLVSVAADRTTPVVAPRGMRAVPCADGDDFIAYWSTLR